MADIKLKNRSGTDVTYTGVKTIQVPKADGTKEDFINPQGNINITDTQITDVRGKATAQVVDANLKAENIAKDVTVLGITGTHEGGGGGEFPQLHAPTSISLSKNIVTISRNSENGNFAENYKVYIDGAYIATATPSSLTSSAQIDLSSTSARTGSLTVSTCGTNFQDSEKSAAVSYTRYYTVTFMKGVGQSTLATKEVEQGGNAYYNTGIIQIDGNWCMADTWLDENGNSVSLTDIQSDITVYADWVLSDYGPLENTSWEDIATVSASHMGANYWQIGDKKSIVLNGISWDRDYEGSTGTKYYVNNFTTYVFIIGFDHNADLEGSGISFGTFKDASGQDYAIGSCSFAKNYLYNAWGSFPARYSFLGSTDVPNTEWSIKPSSRTKSDKGQNATSTCATNPLENSLMSCFPSDLRAVMKPISKQYNFADYPYVSRLIDYLPLMSEKEVVGNSKYSVNGNLITDMQYDYYKNGNSTKKYRITLRYNASDANNYGSTYSIYGLRSSPNANSYVKLLGIKDDGTSKEYGVDSGGLSPVFLV